MTAPGLQRDQLLGVLVASLVVVGNCAGDGRERNSSGGRIRASGGLGNTIGGGSVVQAVSGGEKWGQAPAM